jgi:hypothetical protein
MSTWYRTVGWTCLILLGTWHYWEPLVLSLNDSKWQAALIVLLAWVCGCIDTTDMVGQPHHDD